MQGQAFSRIESKAHYLVFELAPKDLEATWKKLEQVQLKGFNVTIPYKEKVISFLDRVSPEARRIGAVNTVYRQGTKWCGTNTDVYGFLTSLKTEADFTPRNKKVLVLGAGGAARAAVYGLSAEGAKEIVIINRKKSRASAICGEYRCFFPKVFFQACGSDEVSMKALLGNADLIVNATSIGLKKTDSPLIHSKDIPAAGKAGEKVFYDLIYSPRETAFLKNARRKGHFGLNGVGMLVLQGAKAFEYWTKRKAPVEVMRKALLEALEQKEKR